MRILFSTVSPAHYMAPPRLSDEQINCGPFFDNVEIGGRLISLRTPMGEYDLAAVIECLPGDQKPEAVVCLVDASWFNLPQNLAAIRCPKIALVADTHHMGKPINGMIKYLKSQDFDRHVFLYTRHHLELFRAAGLKNLHWFPGLTFPHGDAKVRAARQEKREPRLALVGQVGSLHARRQRLAGAVASRKLPLAVKGISQSEGLSFYGTSLLGLNVTLNADLNLRAFEMLAAGTAMLMDRLAPESGLSDLWRDGHELVTYGSTDELIERARHFLANPEAARAIGEAGACWFDRYFNATRRRAAFLDLLLHGRDLPEFAVAAPASPRIVRPEFGEMLAVYEHLQQLHCTQETVQVRLDPTAPADFEWLCRTLPRIQITRAALPAAPSSPQPDLVVVNRTQATGPAALTAPRVWCWNASTDDRTRWRQRLLSAGLAMTQADHAFYVRPEPESPLTVDHKAATAREMLQKGDRNGAFENARQALEENPRCVEAYLVMAELAHETGNQALVAKMLAKVRSLAPADPRPAVFEFSAQRAAATLARAWWLLDRREWNAAGVLAARAVATDPELPEAHFVQGLICLRLGANSAERDVSRQTGNGLKSLRTAVALAPRREDFREELALALRQAGLFSEAVATFKGLLELDETNPVGWLGLGEAHLKLNQVKQAAAAFSRGLEHAPDHRGLMLWLGHALKRQGQLDEALRLHRRAVGATDTEPLRLRSGKRRVVFLVQHGPSWTCTASVYEAFAADPDWEAVIVALPYIHPFYSTKETDETNAIFDFLHKERIPHVRWDEFPLAPGFADVVFVQNPYDVTRPPEWQVPHLLKLVPRLAYVPYGLEIAGGAYANNLVMNLPLQQLAWLVCARSERQRQAYARHCLTGNAHVSVTGHAKLDALQNLSAVGTDELDRFAAGRKVIGWNPHFDIQLNGTEFGRGISTFLRWRDFLPAEFARRQDLAFVIRPHPLFFAALADRGIMAASQVEEFLRRCAAAGNIFIDRAPSHLPLFARADALLSDASSFVLEFSVTGRPVLFLRNPHGQSLNEDGDFVLHHLYSAEWEADITSFLDMVAAGEDPRAAARRKAYGEYMYQPPGGAGLAVKRAVIERLALEPADWQPAGECELLSA